MYEVPSDQDWSFLLKNDLIQVCYGQYQTQLRFEHDVIISIEGDIEHRDEDEVLTKSEAREQNATSFLLLLGHRIESVAVEDKHTLALVFSNSHTLRLYAGEPDYESFSISVPGAPPIIV